MSIHPPEAKPALPRIVSDCPADPVLRSCWFAAAADVKCLELLPLPGVGAEYGPFPLLPVVMRRGELRLMEDSGRRVAAALASLDRLPRAVHICPFGDPFLPIGRLQKEVAAVVRVLADRGIQAWFTTRGFIQPELRPLLARYSNFVKVRIGLSTLDRRVQQGLEPFAAPPVLRLRQIARLRSAGIAVQVTLEPLVPGLTDSRENLCCVFGELANLGIRHVSAGYLALPIAAEESYRDYLAALGWDETVLAPFAEGFVRREGASLIRYLPKGRRQQGYARLMTLAADFGITVSVSAASNPDFAKPAPRSAVVQPELRFSFLPTQSFT